MFAMPRILRQSFTKICELPRYVRPQSKNKVFCIGFNKTGTSSLHSLFGRLGYRSYHGVKWRDTNNNKLLYKYDCFSDGIPDDFTNLDRMFPGSKYILQVRELDRWLISRLEHIRRSKEKGQLKDAADWLNDSDDAIKYWIEKWNNHHIRVLTYFMNRQSDLLIVNYVRDPKAASKICNYLGHPDIGSKSHRNKNRSRRTVSINEERVYSVLRGLSIPESEYGNDILCPSMVSGQAVDGFPSDTSQLKENSTTTG